MRLALGRFRELVSIRQVHGSNRLSFAVDNLDLVLHRIAKCQSTHAIENNVRNSFLPEPIPILPFPHAALTSIHAEDSAPGHESLWGDTFSWTCPSVRHQRRRRFITTLQFSSLSVGKRQHDSTPCRMLAANEERTRCSFVEIYIDNQTNHDCDNWARVDAVRKYK